MRVFAGSIGTLERVGVVGMDNRGRGRCLCPVVHGPAGCKAPARPRNSPACGQAVASASLMRLAVSTMRAPIFSSFSRKVANSATGSGWGLGVGARHFTLEQIGGGVQNEPHLIGERRAAGGSIRRQLALVQFDQIFHLAARTIERFGDMFG